MTDEQAKHMRAWLQATMDALNAAQAIASRGGEAMEGTDGFLPMHELSIAIGQFTQRGDAMLAARAVAHPRR